MAEYNSTSKKAEEFINDEKIKSTLAFAQEHKDDLELMNEILEKGREYKGLSYAERRSRSTFTVTASSCSLRFTSRITVSTAASTARITDRTRPSRARS